MQGCRNRSLRIAALGLLGVALIAILLGSTWARQTSATASQWRALEPSPLARTEVGAARIGDRIYAVGGFVPQGGNTGKLVSYDISEDRWRRLEPLPLDVDHSGVAALDGRLYLLGGCGCEGRSNKFFRYTPEQDRWQRLPNAHIARAALALVPFDGKLYAIGGLTPTENTGAVEIYDPDTRAWRDGTAMPTPRNHIGAAVLGGRIYVTGGRVTDANGTQNLDVVESYSPQSDSWRTEPSLTTARSGHATVAVAERIVAFGGEQLAEGDQTIASVEALRAGGEWSTAGLPAMRTPRHGLGAAAFKGRIYALEGGPQPGLSFSNALEVLRVR